MPWAAKAARRASKRSTARGDARPGVAARAREGAGTAVAGGPAMSRKAARIAAGRGADAGGERRLLGEAGGDLLAASGR